MNSLRTKLILRLLVGGVLLLGLTGIVFQWRMRVALTREFDSALMLTAQSIQAFVEEKGQNLRLDSDVDGMPEFNREMGSAVFVLRLPDGKELKHSRSLGDASLPLSPLGSGEPLALETRLADGRKLRCVALPIPTRSHGTLQLVVGRLRKPLEHTLEDLGEGLMAAAGFSLVALAALVWWGVRSGLAPLNRLVGEVATVNATSLATRFGVTPLPSELQPIAMRLNELLERLEAVFAKEKRFTADVAHELRTPLAELRTLAEVNLMVPPESAAESASCWLDVKNVSGRMESLALRLLELARAEQPGALVRRVTVDFPPLLEAMWKRHATQAMERDITLECKIPEGFTLHGDPVLLEIIVSNLCGNAVQHAATHSILSVTAGEDGTVIFSNDAPDLSVDDLPHLFERFWKKDASRTDSRRHGLGLALAAEAATLSGGGLRARFRADDGRLEFILDPG